MYKKISVAVAIALLTATQAVSVTFASEEASLSGQNRLGINRESRMMQGERKELRAENREVVEDMNAQKKTEAIVQITNRVEKRFANNATRLEKWIVNVTAFIERKEAAGKDMSKARTALESAKTALASANALAASAVAKLRAVTPENWKSQSVEAQAARKAVKDAQVAYAQVVKGFHTVLKEIKAVK